MKKYGRIDVWVNNAGIQIAPSEVENVDILRKTLDPCRARPQRPTGLSIARRREVAGMPRWPSRRKNLSRHKFRSEPRPDERRRSSNRNPGEPLRMDHEAVLMNRKIRMPS